MKTIIFTLTLILSALLLKAQNETTTTVANYVTKTSIKVTVPVQSNEGTIIIGLHNETTFMKSEALQTQDIKIVDGKAVATFNNVEPGLYGIMVLHDKNGNKQMDLELNGIPKEDYGVSNNVMSFGPPQWKDAEFEVTDKPLELEIRL